MASDVDGLGARSPPVWLWWLAALALAAVLAAPFFVVDVPPVLDYPNHLARFFILAHPHDPFLSRFYQPHWRLLPNLAMDFIGADLLRVFSVHLAGRLILALSLFAPVAGVIIYSRAVFGRRLYWPLASGLIAYNGVFFMGFMNFLLSAGLAMAGAGAWIVLRRRGVAWRLAPLAMLMMSVTFMAHLFGAGLLALLTASYEFAELLGLRRQGRLTRAAGLQSLALVVLAVSPAVILLALSPASAAAPSAFVWAGATKVWMLFTPFEIYSKPLTLITGAFVFGVLILTWRTAKFAPGLGLALAILLILSLAAPETFQGGSFVDIRFSLMIGMLLFAGVSLDAPMRWRWVLIAGMVGLIAMRVLYVAMTWSHHRQDLAELRAAMAKVEPGSRVLESRAGNGAILPLEPPERSLPGLYRTDWHLGALLPIERHAFWPQLFADPAQQPMVFRPPYDHDQRTDHEPIPWALLKPYPAPGDHSELAQLQRTWRADFDYVLLVNSRQGDPAPRGLTPLYAGRYVVLYKIQGSAF